jgi:hypothetical protein
MKRLMWILIVFLIFYTLTRNWGGEAAPSTSQADYSVSGNEEALIEIRAEPKVREAIITEANVLYVSVDDDGTRRDGYASYLCEILKEKKAKADRVKVVKVNSANAPDRDNAYGILLGEAWCR